MELLCIKLFYILMLYRSYHLQFMSAIEYMLSKYMYGRMSLFQKLVSSILYAGHSGTIVSNQYFNMYMSLCIIGLCKTSESVFMYEQECNVRSHRNSWQWLWLWGNEVEVKSYRLIYTSKAIFGMSCMFNML